MSPTLLRYLSICRSQFHLLVCSERYLEQESLVVSQRKKGTSYYCGADREGTQDGVVVIFDIVVQNLMHYYDYFPGHLPQHLHS